MLSKLTYPLSGTYKTGKEYEPLHFFLDVLPNSKRFDLLLGYFSSSAIHVLSLGFAHFIAQGGKMRMVINDVLSEKDKQLLEQAQTGKTEVHFSLQDLVQLQASLDSYGKHFFECVAYLIAQKRIEIVAIRPKNTTGIAHYKSGVFEGGTDKVLFKGSCNFTAKALLENLEELDIYRSWKNETDNAKITEFEKDFEHIFSGNASFAEYIEIAEIQGIISNQFSNKDLDELLTNELELLKSKDLKIQHNPRLQQKVKELEKSIQQKQNEPKFPYPSGARAYQIEAYQNWVKNEYKGIFAMATGTGKTITSLNCLLEIYKQTTVYQAIILVPTNVLITQWEKECHKFKYQNIYKISSKYDWEKDINSLYTTLTWNKDAKLNFILIATYKTFFSKTFQETPFYKKLPNKTLFIADEAHNLASPKNLAYLQDFKFPQRIGLSATPQRIYDEAGTEEIENFFSDKPPYIINFNMQKAIEENFLCPYLYYPKIVTLTHEETAEYIKITKKISRSFASNKQDISDNNTLQTLLMQRKRILHKAENKLKVFREILTELKDKDKLHYTLVYAPEGFQQQGREDSIEFDDEAVELDNIINLYSKTLRETSPETTTTQYTSSMFDKDKQHSLAQFEAGKIDVLFSMKCLDEGVDIPRTETAIFCSSTGNPRQFIQRRGRILRTHPDKIFATIYDLVVVPEFNANSPYIDIERKLLAKELQRVANFANLSNNYYEALANIQEAVELYGINFNVYD